MADDRTLGDLVRRIVIAQSGMGVKNPNRQLFAECLAVIRYLGDELLKTQRKHGTTITRLAEDVAGDSGAGVDAADPARGSDPDDAGCAAANAHAGVEARL